MLKEKYVSINGHRTNYLYYKNLGYEIEYKKPISIKVEDLMPGTTTKVICVCDKCGRESTCEFRFYFDYTNGLTTKYFCKSCSIQKSKQTCIEKYGVDNPMKSEEVKSILKSSLLEKYGVEHYSMTDAYKSKYKKTCLEKYGYTNSFQAFKSKIKEISLDKYGGHYMSLPKVKKELKLIKQKKTGLKYKDIIDDVDYTILNYEDENFTIFHNLCNNIFLIGRKLLYARRMQNVCICTNCNKIGQQSSFIESEFLGILNDNNIKFIKKDRKILDGLELDIYIPELNLALEINGVYWHSEIYKEKNYHLNKTSICNDKGISLLHIWEDDWKYKKEIVKSILLNKLGLIKDKVYARKCNIIQINSKTSIDFLDRNHIQGSSPSQVKIGLEHNGELVSLMTLGYRYTNGKKEFELIRFCNKLNLNVIGAASKIFSFFLKNYEYDNIISYSDISMFDGGMYQKLGFTEVSISDPSYFWVIGDIRRHRFNYSKKKLIKMGYDVNKTEVEIMHELGYFRIWGCGQKKWLYKRKKYRI